MKILWIDDDVKNLDPQIRALERRGFVVEPYADIDRAWERLQKVEEAPLCVILDLMMGTGKLLIEAPTNGGLKTGEQFLRLLRDKGLLVRMKIFVFTITNTQSTRELCEELKIHFYRKQQYPGKLIADLAISEFGTP